MTALSFEVFPPKSGATPEFVKGVADLGRVGAFVSVTYGASGSGRQRSVDAVDALIRAGLQDDVAPHVTAAGQNRATIRRLIDGWKSRSIRRFIALRGDAPPSGQNEFTDSIDLTATLAGEHGIDVSVACYPEGHPKSASPTAEMDHLKKKFDAGAARAISQFFFDIDLFLRFRDRCAGAGIDRPIVPGLLPIASLKTLHLFADRCGATVPAWLDARFSGLEDDPQTLSALSLATTLSLAERLTAEGVDHIHLYTLNRYRDALTFARGIGVSPTREEEAA